MHFSSGAKSLKYCPVVATQLIIVSILLFIKGLVAMKLTTPAIELSSYETLDMLLILVIIMCRIVMISLYLTELVEVV